MQKMLGKKTAQTKHPHAWISTFRRSIRIIAENTHLSNVQKKYVLESVSYIRISISEILVLRIIIKEPIIISVKLFLSK